MHRFLPLAALWFGGVLTTLATPLGFSDAIVTLRNQAGTALDSASVEFGTFGDGFVPTALNRADWAAHWRVTGTGYYAADSGTPEMSAELLVSDNTILPIGEQLYLWVYSADQKALYTDPAWTVPAASPLGLGQVFQFSAQTTAVFGRFDSSHLFATIAASDLGLLSQPASQAVALGGTATFSVQAEGTGPFTYQWQKDGQSLSGATDSTLVLNDITPNDAGSYAVIVSDPNTSITSEMAVLSLIGSPAIVAQPQPVSVSLGHGFVLTVGVDGIAPFTFQWFHNGTAIAGATLASYTVAAASATSSGDYYVRIGNELGSVSSAATTVSVDFGPYLSNLSVRASMRAQQNLIVGFVVNGGSKSILVRAAGPALNSTFGLSDYLADPQLTLFNAQNQPIDTNDDWDAALATTFASLGAFSFVSTSKDAALLQTLAYANTAHAPAGSAGGTQLVEVYDAGTSNGVKLVNVSARNYCGTGNDILIAGFVIAGSGKHPVLLRGVGPGLTHKFGLTGVLADPKLTLFNAQNQPIDTNDNWDATLATTFSTLGAFDLAAGSKDAALLVELDAGVYTVQVQGADGGTGETLVEIYDAAP